MSLSLRHRPEAIGISLDRDGWCDLEKFVNRIKVSKPRWGKVTIETIYDLVERDDKQRYTIENGRIRAAQGHTNKAIDIRFKEVVPTHDLFHGTSRRAYDDIRKSGLLPMRRQYVHLSVDKKTAQKVGSRHDSKPIIFKVNVQKALEQGVVFYLSDNNVYLCKHVPFSVLESV